MGRILYHYTTEAGLAGILATTMPHPSTLARNPKDVRFGEGQYLTDIAPGTMSPARLSRALLGQPFQGKRFTHFVAIELAGLDVREGRDRVFVIPGDRPLDLSGRIVGHGPIPSPPVEERP